MPPKRRQPPARKRVPMPPGASPTEWWRRPIVLAAAAAGALVLAVGAIAIVLGQGANGSSPDEKLAAAGCTFKTYPDLGARHVSSYDAKIDYNSNPPTSGPHYERPVIWGAYPTPVPPVAEVHNLEHGGIVIHYGSAVDAETKARLTEFYDDSPNAMLLAPMPSLGDKVTLSAWTKLATCDAYDAGAFAAFRSAFRGNGPERFRIGDLAPGT